ncbi:MAG: heavy-metal-associated domain-containing protein [Haliscomenobacter sp.]
MKFFISCLAILLATCTQASAQSIYGSIPMPKSEKGGIKSAEIMVYGNCGMCERRIEGALKELSGVRTADWSTESKMLSVSYDSKKVTLMEIKEKVASVGHDTDEVRAPDAVYNALHGCCKYERPAKL